MEKLLHLKKLMIEIFTTPEAWIFFPFTIYCISFSLVYIILFCGYMLLDYVVIEFRKVLNEDNEKNGAIANGIKYFFGFFFYFQFVLFRIIISIPMAILYFLIAIFAFVGSIGNVRVNPFAFHEEEKQELENVKC